MTNWKIFFTTEAEGDIEILERTTEVRVLKKLDWLENNFDAITPLPLSNKWKGFFKLRVGDFRIIYELKWTRNEIIIVVVRLRSEVYKTKFGR